MDPARAAFPIAVVSVVLLVAAAITLVVKGDGTSPDVTAPSELPTSPAPSQAAPTTEPPGTPGPTTEPSGPTTSPTTEPSGPTTAPTVSPTTSPTDGPTGPDGTGGPDGEDPSDREPDPANGESMPNTGAGLAVSGLLLLAAAGGRRGRR